MSGSQPISVLVFGAGAIGTYVGGSLAAAGHRVTFLENASITGDLRQRGLRMDLSVDKARKMAPILQVPPASFTCFSSLEQAMEHGPYDAAVFAMKSFDTEGALQGIQPFAEGMPPILCLRNGVENEALIAAVLGPERVIPGTVTCSIARRSAGDIVLEKKRGIGLSAAHPLSLFLCEAMNYAGLNARMFPHPQDMKWSKLLSNLPAGATSAILDMTPAEVYAHPALYDLELRMMREALRVISAQGFHVVNLPGMPLRLLALALRLPGILPPLVLKKVVGGGRGGKMPSFHIDLHSGRKTSEVEWLQGAVVRFGEKSAIPTPVNRLLTGTLLSMVHGEVPISAFSRQIEKLLALI